MRDRCGTSALRCGHRDSSDQAPADRKGGGGGQSDAPENARRQLALRLCADQFAKVCEQKDEAGNANYRQVSRDDDDRKVAGLDVFDNGRLVVAPPCEPPNVPTTVRTPNAIA